MKKNKMNNSKNVENIMSNEQSVNLQNNNTRENDVPNALPTQVENKSNSNMTTQSSELSMVSNAVYNISGKVWIDKNKNGIYDDGEQGEKSVLVSLYRSNANKGIESSNKVSDVMSDDDGNYTFTGVNPGNYVVVFVYDSSFYSVTKYQVSKATSSENSDAVSKNITLEGENVTVGLTDVLTINNASLINIDMGLVTKNNFDLNLDKQISNIVVRNSEGTKTYQYDNGKNEKLR